MVNCFQPAFAALLALAFAAAAGTASPGAGTQASPPQATAGPDVRAIVARIDQVRLDYTSSRVAGAQLELSNAIDLVRAARDAHSAAAGVPDRGRLPRAGSDAPMPGLLRRYEPEYPLEAARKGVAGHVIVDAVIDRSGKIRDARIARSIPELDGAALTAVRKWRFAKPRFAGAPADLETTIVLAFTVRREMPPPADLDLARFHVERADFAAAEAPLARALEAISREAACNAAVSDAAGTQRRAAAGGFEPVRKTRDVRPVYPALALRAKVSGTVMMDAVIGTDGRPTCLRVLKSVPLLDQAAIDAVSRWEFTPALRDGAPTPARISMEVTFSLR